MVPPCGQNLGKVTPCGLYISVGKTRCSIFISEKMRRPIRLAIQFGRNFLFLRPKNSVSCRLRQNLQRGQRDLLNQRVDQGVRPESLLGATVRQALGIAPVSFAVLDRFAEMVAQDSSSIMLPEVLAMA
jgi:hypothetical protein